MSDLLPATAPAPSPAPSPQARATAPRARAVQGPANSTPTRRAQGSAGASAFADALAEAGVPDEASGPVCPRQGAAASPEKSPTFAPSTEQTGPNTPPLTICVAPVVVPPRDGQQGEIPPREAGDDLVDALVATIAEGPRDARPRPSDATTAAGPSAAPPADATPPVDAIGVPVPVALPPSVTNVTTPAESVAAAPAAVAPVTDVPAAGVPAARVPTACVPTALVPPAGVTSTLPRARPAADDVANAQTDPARTADAVHVEVGDAIDTPPSPPVAAAAPAGAAAVPAASDAAPAPAGVVGPPVDRSHEPPRPEATAESRAAASPQGIAAGGAARAESRRSARTAVRNAIETGQAQSPAVPPAAPSSEASPVARAAVTAAHVVVAAEAAGVVVTSPRVRSVGPPVVGARQAVEATPLAPSTPSTNTEGHGASARDGRSSTDVFAPLRTAAPLTGIDVPATAVQAASAWMARMAQAAVAPPEGTTLTTGTAQAWGVPDQIVRGLQLQIRTGAGEATIRLHPEHLGEIVVEMKVENEGVVATLKSDTPAVRAWIAAHRDDLEAGLADSGLRLDELRVSDRDTGQDRRERQESGERPKRRTRRAPESDARFEVLA